MNTIISPEDTGNTWFYEVKGEKKGAIPESEMINLIESGAITYGTAVWKQGFPEWFKIENTDLKTYLNETSPPPLQGDNINNTVVWFLAFAPLIGYFLEFFIAGAIHGSEWKAEQEVSNGTYFYITLILNIGLSYYDEKSLTKAGHNTDKFKGMTWLVPVYLFQRAKNLNQNMSYFAVWTILFILILLS